MSASITKANRIANADKYIKTNFGTADGNVSHFYTGKPSAWDDETSPDISTSAENEITSTRKDRVFMKRINESDAILAIKRFNWITGTIYSRADHNAEYTDYRNWYHPESPFYVINSEGNVYKCISNAYDTASTVEPTGQPNGYLYLGDSYVWKFMLDLSEIINDTFLSDTWIPIPFDADKSFAQLQVESNVVVGDIIHIHVDNGGSAYTAVPTIQIRGDGTGATAVAVMSGNVIQSVTVTNAGTGYTYADVLIFGNGIDASASAMVSPPGGHGSDAIYELGAYYVEVSMELVGDEDGFLPTTGTYRNIGVVQNTENTSAAIISDEKLNTLSTINISNCSGTYTINEVVIGNTSLAQGYVYYDPSGVNKDILLYNVDGTFIDGEDIYGQDSAITGEYVLASSTINTTDVNTGDILYKENIRFITRKEIQSEKFIFTIEF